MTKLTTQTPVRGLTHDLTGEDAQLDALLKAAKPTADAAREAALLERIMAAAEISPRLSVVAGNAVSSAPQRGTPVERATAVAAPYRPVRRDLWGAGGLLAASLVLGVLVGQSSYSYQTATRIEQATGFTLASASHEVARMLASAEADEDDTP